MLASSSRLKKPRAIARVFSRGRQGASGPIKLKASANGSPISRAVVVVTKKVSKRAVVRNRIRRRLSALLAEHWATVASGYDIVVTVQSDVAEAPIGDLDGHLIVAMDKAKIKTAP